jgi:hypothetical protein
MRPGNLTLQGVAMSSVPRLFLYLPPDPAGHGILWPRCPVTVELADQVSVRGAVADVLDDADTSPANEQIRELVRSVLDRRRLPLQPALMVRCRFERPPQVERLPAMAIVRLADDPELHALKLAGLGFDIAEYPGRELPLHVVAINRRVARDDGPDETTRRRGSTA